MGVESGGSRGFWGVARVRGRGKKRLKRQGEGDGGLVIITNHSFGSGGF